MSSNMMLLVENLSKRYQVYHAPLGRLKEFFIKGNEAETFEALSDVSFEIKKGQSVGIVGKNGSGKSTLLQLIAGTLTPTSGKVHVKGKVVALLELGAGFNMDFTGQENVMLNASLFGLSKEEIEDIYEKIIAFADIGKHIDQPVKTYSSGMFARLAFAVAIHMKPDLLIVDEILSVGDLSFQTKCITKLRKMMVEGLTLLFVSHSVDAIKSLCNSAVLLEKGKLVDFGTSEKITNLYLANIREELNHQFRDLDSDDHFLEVEVETNIEGLKYGEGEVFIESARLVNTNEHETTAFEFGEEATLRCTVSSKIQTENVNVSFLIRDFTGIDLFGTTMFDEKIPLFSLKPNEKRIVSFKFPVSLRSGSYSVSVAVNRVSQKDYSDVYLFQQVDGASSFEVVRKMNRPVHYKVYFPVKIESSEGEPV